MKRIVLELDDNNAAVLLNQTKTNEQGERVLDTLRSGNTFGISAKVIEEGYKVENLELKLRKLKDNFNELKKSGFGYKLLEAYVRQNGISKRDFDAVMFAVADFFRQLD